MPSHEHRAEVKKRLEVRLRAAGDYLVRRRRPYSQAWLANHAVIGERTVRRIEAGKPADLPSYAAVADVLGLPLDWFVNPEGLAEPASAASASAEAEASISAAGRSGLLGPQALALLRESFAFVLENGSDGRDDFDALTGGWGDQLRLEAARRRVIPRRSAGS